MKLLRSLGISVQEMLAFEILKKAKVLAGHGGLERRVTRINVMEVPDIVDWVGTGEFLLTTAYSIKDELNILKNLIPELNKKGLAGIGIKMKRYVEQIPKDIIELANNLDFPIIEIPFEVSYTDIMMPVLTEVINNQTNTLLMVKEIHSKLINVMLEGGSFKRIAEEISETIGNTVAIKDNIFDSMVICCQGTDSEEIEKILEKEKLSIEGSYRIDLEKNSIFSDDLIKGRKIRRISIPIYVHERNYGFLYIWEDNRKINSVERTSIESATPIIALDLMKKISIFEIESRHKIEFFDDLLSKDEKSQRRAIDRAALFDFDRKLSYGVMVISITNIKGFIKETLNNSNFLYQMNSKILQIIERINRSRKEKCVYGNKSDRIIILYGVDKAKSQEEVKQDMNSFAKDILQYVDYEMKDLTLSIGIGRLYEEATELWKSYHEAMKAAKNNRMGNKNKFIHYDDLGVYRVLCSDEMEEELTQFYKETLAPLVDYDRDKDSELVKTLQMYFQYGGNLKKISKEMFTHYNTIIYRIQRIMEITGKNLEDANDSLSLQVALKILEIIK